MVVAKSLFHSPCPVTGGASSYRLVTTAKPVYDLVMPVIKRLFPLFLTAFGILGFCQSGMPTAPEPKEQDGRWGYVNQAGVFVIAPKYFAAQSFVDGLALFSLRLGHFDECRA